MLNNQKDSGSTQNFSLKLSGSYKNQNNGYLVNRINSSEKGKTKKGLKTNGYSKNNLDQKFIFLYVYGVNNQDLKSLYLHTYHS